MLYGRLLGQNLSVAGKIFEIDRPVNLIGRGKDCTIVVLDPSVSRMHAKVTVDEESRLRVEDLRSSNGSFLNDQRIESGYLRHGDRVRTGNVEFVVELAEEFRQNIDADIVQAKSNRGLTLWILLVALVVGGGGWLTYYLFLRPDPMAPGWIAAFDGYEQGLAKLGDGVKEDFLEDKLDFAEQQIKGQNWAAALDTYNRLATADLKNQEVKDGITRVNMELTAKKAFADAKEAEKKNDYVVSIKNLKAIPKESAYYAGAQEDLKALMSVKDELKKVAAAACKQGSTAECLAFLKQAQAIDPSDAEINEQIKKLEGGK
jgi:pSer/pThr/pTyr-binding forkhead associated (FHA) protein